MIVVTGAGGFIGSHVVKHLMEQDESVWILDDKDWFDVANPQHWYDPAKIPQVGVRAVVHCAGALMIDGHSPETYMRTNALGTVHAVEYCSRTGAKLIFLHTHSDVNASKDLYISEQTPRAFVPALGNGSAAFVASKIAAVEVIEAFNRANLLYGVILRLANVRGYGSQDTKHKTFFHQMIQKAERCEDIELWGDLTTIRDLIYVKDVARAVDMAIKKAPPGMYNIGTGRGMTWEHEVKCIVDVFTPEGKTRSKLIWRPEKKELRTHSCVFLFNKAFECFGWVPAYDYREGLQDMKQIRDETLRRG